MSILPVLFKILERVVYKPLLSHLENNGLLSDVVRKEVDNGNILDAVFIDLSKASDTVSHSCLLNELPSNGINGLFVFSNANRPI